jgi:hypothetical protein
MSMPKGTTFQRLKPHTRAKLEFIPQETREKLVDWLLNHPLNYRQVCKKLKEECGLQVGRECVAKFYRKWVWPRLVERREHLVDFSDDYTRECKRKPGSFYGATLDALAQRGMRIAMDEETSPKEMKLIIDSLIRLREQTIKEQKLELYLKQIKLAEKRLKAAEELAKESKLTKEELVDKFRRIFHGDQNSQTNTQNGEGGGGKKVSDKEPRFTHGFSN